MNKSVESPDFRSIIIFCSLISVFCQLGCVQQNSVKQSQVCYKDKCFNVEIVSKPAEMQRGLMFREFLPAEAGMLFVFPDSQPHSFWMKNTLIPLDMIWIDHSQNIVDIISHVPPCQADPCLSYTPKASALYVLELNAGVAQRAGLIVGERVDFR